MNNVDYQALCKELFGTDDVKVLRKIAQTAGTHNPRNAGRKKACHLQIRQAPGNRARAWRGGA